jgi:hypothetical protein
MLCRARLDRVVVRPRRRKGGQRRCCGHPAACGTNRTIMGPAPSAGHSPIGSFLRACYLAPVAQGPSAQLRPYTAKLGRQHDGHAPPMTGPMRSLERRYPGPGSVADGGVVVLVSWLVSMCATAGHAADTVDMDMLVPVHLGGCGAMATHLPPGRACQNATQVAGPGSPAVDRQADRQPPDNRGPRRMTLDGYIYVLSCADAAGGDCPSNVRIRWSKYLSARARFLAVRRLGRMLAATPPPRKALPGSNLRRCLPPTSTGQDGL